MTSVSKAIAGALASILIALLAKWHVVLTPEVSDAVSTILQAVMAAIVGFVVVWHAPSNRPKA